MNISKLTLTPIMAKTQSVIIHAPTAERASFLIKEKLVSGSRNFGCSKKYSKLPAFLKGFVNPKTHVGKSF